MSPMSENRGKQFEKIVKECFERVPGVSIDRVHDQMSGYSGSKNICDFIVYKKPYECYIECKTVHGNTLPFSNITETQWNGLLEKSNIDGVIAGILCWYVDKDITAFIPIHVFHFMKKDGSKSFPIGLFYTQFAGDEGIVCIPGTKKRVFFDYDFSKFFDEVKESLSIDL